MKNVNFEVKKIEKALKNSVFSLLKTQFSQKLFQY